MKHIDVQKIEPRYGITLSKEQLVYILRSYLRDNDVRLGGKIITGYSTSDGGYYLLLEEEKTDE